MKESPQEFVDQPLWNLLDLLLECKKVYGNLLNPVTSPHVGLPIPSNYPTGVDMPMVTLTLCFVKNQAFIQIGVEKTDLFLPLPFIMEQIHNIVTNQLSGLE